MLMNNQSSGSATPSASLRQPWLLEIVGLSKSWGSTQAASSVSFHLAAGEVLALVGENGAGKSTLLNMLSGVVAPDDGKIRMSGQVVALSSPHAAQALGIGTVFQELSLAHNLTVMENIFAGRLPSRFGLVDRKVLRQKTEALFSTLGIFIDPDATVNDLPVSSRQIVEIAKAVSLDAHVLLLDEPTSALNADEKAVLFRLVLSLKAKGVGIIYISHHLEEVIELADRIVVLRDGAVVSIVGRKEATARSLVRDMVGRLINEDATPRTPQTSEKLLEVNAVSRGSAVRDVSLNVRKGEIVALAGLMGSGRGELAEMIVGLTKPSTGSLSVSGRPVSARGLGAAKHLGIGYIPPERKTQGLFLDLSVAANIAAATLQKATRHGFMSQSLLTDLARRHIGRLSIKASRTDVRCRSLSGGNQQKVLLAKWLEMDPKLLVVEEPTKGVDIAAKLDIHRELRRLAASGTGILMVSSDLPEILSLAHRVLVMHHGRIVADLDCRKTTEHEIIAHASGLTENAHAS